VHEQQKYLRRAPGGGAVDDETHRTVLRPRGPPGEAARVDLARADPGIGRRIVDADLDGVAIESHVGTRAAVTNFALVPKRYFGGSPSGLGQQGFTDVKLLARCPAGFCAASRNALKVFDADGQFAQMIQFAAELGAPLEPAFLVEGKEGAGYLRGFLSIAGSTARTDVVYKMTRK
jgi:hypothetical protein